MKKISQNQLFKEALRAQKNSYSPYSGHRIGAAIRLKSGKIFSGCNVENASYGATICAERTALLKAVPEEKKIQVQEICVISDTKDFWPPCGMCLQVLSEFASAKTKVYLASPTGIQKELLFEELLPQAFSGNFL